MAFKLSLDANINGTSLAHYLDEVEDADLIRVFGPPGPDGYFDEEKGYDGRSWVFTTSTVDGRVFTVYSRFGRLRIGALDDADDFKVWLLAALGK